MMPTTCLPRLALALSLACMPLTGCTLSGLQVGLVKTPTVKTAQVSGKAASLIEAVKALEANMAAIDANATATATAQLVVLQLAPQQQPQPGGMMPPPPPGGMMPQGGQQPGQMQQPGGQQGGMMPPQGGQQGGMPPQGHGQGGVCGAPPQNGLGQNGQNGRMPQGNANGRPGTGAKRVGPQFTNTDLRTAVGQGQHQVTNLANGGKQEHLQFQLNNGQGPRFQVQLDRKQNAAGKPTEIHQQLQADDQGRKITCDRQTVLGDDGQARVTVTGTVVDPTVGTANVSLQKTIDPDGTGTITLPATGETVTFDLSDVDAPEPTVPAGDTLVIAPMPADPTVAAAIAKDDE